MNVEVVKAAREHAEELAGNLSPETAEDLARGWGVTEPEKIVEAIMGSRGPRPLVVLANGYVVCVFGITDENIAWFLPAAGFSRIAYRFVRHCREYLARFLEDRDEIQSYIYEGNEKMIRWLEWCGFSIEEPINGYRRCVLCAYR